MVCLCFLIAAEKRTMTFQGSPLLASFGEMTVKVHYSQSEGIHGGANLEEVMGKPATSTTNDCCNNSLKATNRTKNFFELCEGKFY